MTMVMENASTRKLLYIHSNSSKAVFRKAIMIHQSLPGLSAKTDLGNKTNLESHAYHFTL